jgi:hypothetical protein
LSEYPLKEVGERIREEGHTGRYRRSVLRRYGKKALSKHGTILMRYIDKDTESDDPKIRKEAVLAKTYHRIRIGKRRFMV